MAYQTGCLGQAESCVLAILKELDNVGKSESSVAILHDFVPSFLSFSLVIPIHPDSAFGEQFSLAKLIRRVLRGANSLANINSASDQVTLTSLYISALRLLHTCQWRMFPYHIRKHTRFN